MSVIIVRKNPIRIAVRARIIYRFNIKLETHVLFITGSLIIVLLFNRGQF